MKKLLIGMIAILLLFGLCAELERESNPDGSTPMTEQAITQIWEGIVQGCREIKEGISKMFNSITDGSKEDNTVNEEIGEISVGQLPKDAQEYYNRYENDNWETITQDLEGETKAGKDYKNNPKGEGIRLPENDFNGNHISYKEYDAETTEKGKGRGKKRFIHGSDGTTYYTDDHYETFRKVVK